MAKTRGSGARLTAFCTQLPIDYIDTSLTINTWETVSANLSAGAPAKLWYIIVEQTNNGATAEDIELEITINGTAYTWSITANSGTPYYCFINYNLTTGDFTTASSTTATAAGAGVASTHPISFNAEYVGLVRVQQTTDVDGTSAQIEVNIVWEKRLVT